MLMDVHYEVLRQENLEYEKKPVATFVVKQMFGGVESTLWVAEDGSVIKETTNQGFKSFKEPALVAQQLKEPLTVGNIITMSRVKPSRPIDRPHRVRELIFNLQPIRSPDLIPQDQRQKILAVEPLPKGLFQISLLVRTEPEQIASHAKVRIDPKYLEESAQIQVQHPLIRRLAKELAGDNRDVWRVAQDINRWVFLNLEKELVDTVTALDALHERRGECQSHTYLFTALARAAGIPTRIVNGLVYSQAYDGFLYHAWPEVYVGEWRALDPTFGQNRVDATHIKLTEGDEGGPFRLMEFVGKIKIDWSPRQARQDVNGKAQ